MDKSMNVLIKLMIAEKVIRALLYIIWFLVEAAQRIMELKNEKTEDDTNEIEIRQRIIIE